MLTVVFFPKVEFVSVKGIQDNKKKKKNRHGLYNV